MLFTLMDRSLSLLLIATRPSAGWPDLEADLAQATARAETEAKSRSRAEELGLRSIAEASTLRSQTAALQQQIADMTQQFTEALQPQRRSA